MNIMQKRHLIGTILIVLLAPSVTWGQKTEKLFESAQDLFYKERFNEALPVFQQVLQEDASHTGAQYKAELCSLLIKEYREKSLTRLLQIGETQQSEDKFYYYWMGRVYANRNMFPEAVDAWKKFLARKDAKSMEIIDETKDFIKETQKLVSYFDNPDNYEVFPLKAPINSKYSEMSPVYSAERKELLYASNSYSSGGDLKVYRSAKNGTTWGNPDEISILGTFSKQNASFEVVNEDGKLFFYKDEKGGDLYYSQPGKNGWVAPVEFDSKISTTHLASHFFINEHEDRIIFATSNKKQGLDLFESFKDANSGKWTKPTPFAAVIDSEWDEDSPYLSADEKLLYFSSNRPNGLGGFDIYVSTYDAKKLTWSQPVNLGWPINSPDDDLQFKMTNDAESGYFISNRIHSQGDFDIYYFWSIEKAYVEGRVVNAISNKPLNNGEIRFHPSKYNDEYFRSKTDEYGKYRTEVISDEIFRVEIISGSDTLSIEQFEIHDAKGETITHFKDFYYIPADATPEQVAAYQKSKNPEPVKKESTATNQQRVDQLIARGVEQAKNNPESKNTNTTKTTNSTPVKQPLKQPAGQTQNVQLAKLDGYKTGSKAILHNVYFNQGTSMLTEDSEEVLNELLAYLQRNPRVRVEISGHTDNIGGPDVNQWLSQRRAESVAKWLVKKGVAADRLATKGYGQSMPMASNDDEEGGRELNRRIEVLVIQ